MLIAAATAERSNQMKTRPIKTKLLTALLTLCMLLSLVPLSVFAATPATETADFTVGQGREAITLLNQYKTGTAESLWDNTTKTLTLWGVDFTTTAQTAVKLPAGSTIVLKDGTTNTIQSGEVTLKVSGGYSNEAYVNALDAVGDLTIQGGTAGSGTLSVFAGKLKNSGDGWVYSSGISVDGDFNIKGGQVTARGGSVESDGSCFSFGVKMDSDTKNKALLVTGGTLTAIADKTYVLEEDGTKRESFSRGVEMLRGNVIVSGNGKLRAESVEAMAEATVLSNGLHISAGNLTVANSAEVAVAGAYAAYVSGGSLRLDGGSLTAVSTQTADDNGNLGCAIYMDLNKQVADSGSITVSGGTLETVNGYISMPTIGATGNQSLFTVTGGTVVNRGQLYGPKKLDISGGTIQTQGIDADALTLSAGSLTIREPVRKNPNYDNLLVRPALDVKTLTVSGGTLDAAWDWGEFTPIVFPVNTYYGYADSLVEMTGSGSTATFTGGTTTLDTGKAGNTALLIKGTLTIGDGMAETGADSSHHQLGTAPVKIAAAAASTAIATATIENAKFDYQSGDAPQATAWVAVDDTDKYEIAYECWQQFENNEPVAAWYSDNGSHGSLPTITEFESGKEYVYFVMLKPKDGYSFSSETAVTVNGESVKSSLSGEFLYVPAVKTITIPTIKVIDVVEVNDVTVSFKDGDKPVFTGKVPEGAGYAFRCEWWSLDKNTGLVSTEPEWGGDIYKNKITAFEAGKTYHYGVYVTAYTADISPSAKLKINGREVSYTRIGNNDEMQTFWVETNLTMTPEAGGMTPAEKYTVTYTDGVDGEEIFKDQTYIIEAGKATPAFNGTPAREGYKFAGWSPAVTDTVTGNVTYTAQWEKQTPAETFTVTYTDGVDDEEIFKDQTYTVESGKATPAFSGTPIRKGYTFAGWKPAVAAIVTGNATYEATWKFNSTTTTPSDNKPNTGETTTLRENKPNTGTTTSPKTGDTSNLALWLVLLFVSGGAAIGTTVVSRKKKYNK